MLKDRKNFFEILETAGLRPETAKFQKEISRLRLNIKRKVGMLPEENRGNFANSLLYG